MANNGKGKSIYIGTEEEEWDKVLSNSYLLDLVLEGYGAEPIAEHGSYRQIPPNWPVNLRSVIGWYYDCCRLNSWPVSAARTPIDLE
ncbi:hypothetical protein CTI12_AA389710 [Artemisia annua]|uniref:Uncharacterized protein n=1 Tax=Artemisia annua TaxID=35608 RepID=A0A2U1MDN0_ARTAN|nr:hypothetical protein CTI12_AA389710 [Artemisia annua]